MTIFPDKPHIPESLTEAYKTIERLNKTIERLNKVLDLEEQRILDLVADNEKLQAQQKDCSNAWLLCQDRLYKCDTELHDIKRGDVVVVPRKKLLGVLQYSCDGDECESAEEYHELLNKIADIVAPYTAQENK